MFELILQSLYDRANIHSQSQKEAFLRGLQPHALKLHNAYRAFPVNVDYSSDEAQMVYLLRYFPQYSQLIRLILQSLNADPGLPQLGKDAITASFIGCGPSPEILGFFKLLTGIENKPNKVNINAMDIASDNWAFSRTITFNTLIPSVFSNSIDYNNVVFDLAGEGEIEKSKALFEKSDLVVLQNCLNEINDSKKGIVLQNLGKIIHLLPSGAIIIFIELANYSSVLDTLIDIEENEEVLSQVSILRSSKGGNLSYDAQEIVKLIPDIVRNNFLTGIPYSVENGLIPRRRVNFYRTVLKKTN
jgi:hypothetical protein